MEQIEVSGKTVDAAVENALKRLGRKRHEVTVDVLSSGSRGILGIGGEQALVRVTVRVEEPEEEEEQLQPPPAGAPPARPSVAPPPSRFAFTAPRPTPPPPAPPRPAIPPRPEPPRAEPPRPEPARPEPSRPAPPRPEPRRFAPPAIPTAAVEAASAERKALTGDTTAVAVEVVDTLLRHMGMRARVNVRRQPAEQAVEGEQPVIVLDITGDDLGILIGRRGETLGALQFITNLIVGKRSKQWTRVVIDVEQYRERREERLRSLALHMAERVMQTGQPVTLTAMPANERRIIHITLHDHPRVTTGSIDEGENRRVVILPL